MKGKMGFCGYDRYQMKAGLWRKLSVLLIPLHKSITQGVMNVFPHLWNCLAAIMPCSVRGANICDNLRTGANVLTSVSVDDLYRRLVLGWDDPASGVIGGLEPATLLTGDLSGVDLIQRMMAMDMLTYLPDDIIRFLLYATVSKLGNFSYLEINGENCLICQH